MSDRLLAKPKSMADDPEGMRALFAFRLMVGVIGGIAALRWAIPGRFSFVVADSGCDRVDVHPEVDMEALSME